MAGRFLIQKLAFGISRSRSSLGAHGPSARAAAPAAGTPPVAGTVPAARYFSRTSMLLVTINPVKPVDSFGGKEPLSSMLSTRQQEKMAMLSTRQQEKMAAWASKMDARKARHEASRAKMKAEIAGFNKFVIKVTMLSCFAGSFVLWALFEEEKRKVSARKVGGPCAP